VPDLNRHSGSGRLADEFIHNHLNRDRRRVHGSQLCCMLSEAKNSPIGFRIRNDISDFLNKEVPER